MSPKLGAYDYKTIIQPKDKICKDNKLLDVCLQVVFIIFLIT